MNKKPLTIESLGLTKQQIEHFVKGARTAYGNRLLNDIPKPDKLFTTPKPRK